MEIIIKSEVNSIDSWLTGFGIIISLLTIILAYFEYNKQGKQKRVELLENYRKKFQTDEYCKMINPLNEEDSIELLKIDQMNKYYYLGLFEELAVLINSRIMKVDTVYYFFGYYALRTWESENFWSSINRDSIYWAEFSNFVKLMEKNEQKIMQNRTLFFSITKRKKVQI